MYGYESTNPEMSVQVKALCAYVLASAGIAWAALCAVPLVLFG